MDLNTFAKSLEPVDRTFPLTPAEKAELESYPPEQREPVETMIRYRVAQNEANLPEQSRNEEEKRVALIADMRSSKNLPQG